MDAKLLEIEPLELKFIFELKKQSSCPVRLVNKINNYVAFKVKTTNPKKYCVRPNVGIIKPKSTCDFVVAMQAPKSVSPDVLCKDKFLVQSTVVPVGTADEDITSSTFDKATDKYVQENKLRVILVSPPHSPVLSPMNGTLKQEPANEASVLTDQVCSTVENLSPCHKDTLLQTQRMLLGSVHMNPMDVEGSEEESGEEVKPATDVELKAMKDSEELKLVKDVEEIKSKLNRLEIKLTKAEATILKLTEERRSTAQEGEILRQELALLRSKRIVRTVQEGFPFLFVCMVALISLMLGHMLHS